MGLGCGMSLVKYGLFIFNLFCAVRFLLFNDIQEQTKSLHFNISKHLSSQSENIKKSNFKFKLKCLKVSEKFIPVQSKV